MAKDTVGLGVKKKDNFSEWYQELVLKSELADYTAVSGAIAFRPLGYLLWENIRREVDKKLKKLGVENVYFPMLIPEKYLSKEAEHIEGFSPEVAWVTHTGKSKLSERLAVRPTSETIMYPSYAKWIRSWKDLPIKYNQWNNVIRWEFKNPVPFLRTREFLWNEGHSAFASRKDAEGEMKDIMKLWKTFCKDYLALPFISGKKSEKEKFAGAEYSLSLEFILPNGRAVQGPDAHFDGQKFAKAFGISFLDKTEKKDYVWQNTWAISTRMIGVLASVHGDDKGLVLPPKIVSKKGVIVPIIFKSESEKVIEFSQEVEKKLKKFGVVLDDREGYSAGWKFNEWEMKGVPVRIEIGPKDVAAKKVVLVRRDTGEKKSVGVGKVVLEFGKMLEGIQKNLYGTAKLELEKRIFDVKDLKGLKKVVSDRGIARVDWCGSMKCEENIKDKTGAKSLNSEIDWGSSEGAMFGGKVGGGGKVRGSGKCFACSGEAGFVTYFGKSY